MSRMDKTNKYYDDGFLVRSIPFLTEEGIKKLRNSTIAIAGLGGVGGATVVTLARLGVGNFVLADPRRFDEPDINRQWAAFKSTLGKNKTVIYEKVLKDINPAIKVKKLIKGISCNNLSAFLEKADIVIDVLDLFFDYESRRKLYRQAKEKKIFILTSSVVGFGATLMGFSPSGMKHEDFMKSWNKNIPVHIKKYFLPRIIDLVEIGMQTHKVPSLSLSCSLAGSLLATESLVVLLQGILPNKRQPIIAPKFEIVDLFTQKYEILDVTKLK